MFNELLIFYCLNYLSLQVYLNFEFWIYTQVDCHLQLIAVVEYRKLQTHAVSSPGTGGTAAPSLGWSAIFYATSSSSEVQQGALNTLCSQFGQVLLLLFHLQLLLFLPLAKSTMTSMWQVRRRFLLLFYDVCCACRKSCGNVGLKMKIISTLPLHKDRLQEDVWE